MNEIVMEINDDDRRRAPKVIERANVTHVGVTERGLELGGYRGDES